MRGLFEGIKEAKWWVIAAVVAVDIAITVFIIAAFDRDLFGPIVRLTGGLINDTMAGTMLLLLAVVGGLIFLWGRLRPVDVGLRRGLLGEAALFIAVMWLLTQLATLIVAIWSPDAVFGWNPVWERRGVTTVLGLLVAQLFGNALYEEIAFRGFLLPQLYLKLRSLAARPAWRLVAAVLVSQALFASIHIPIRLWNGVPLGDLPASLLWVLVLGIIYTVVWLRTGNLLIAVGVHALGNYPGMLFVADAQWIALGVGLLLALVWPLLRRLRTTHDQRPQAIATLS